MQENKSSRHNSVTAAVSNGQTTSQALTEVANKKTSDISKQSPSPLHHPFLLGRARFTAQPLSALLRAEATFPRYELAWEKWSPLKVARLRLIFPYKESPWKYVRHRMSRKSTVGVRLAMDLTVESLWRYKCFFGASFLCRPGGATLGISGWGCAAGTLEPLTYTRASSAEFCYPILE